jgi:hypothetical protein
MLLRRWIEKARESNTLRGGDMDLMFVGITILFFAISGWLISALEKL